MNVKIARHLVKLGLRNNIRLKNKEQHKEWRKIKKYIRCGAWEGYTSINFLGELCDYTKNKLHQKGFRMEYLAVEDRTYVCWEAKNG